MSERRTSSGLRFFLKQNKAVQLEIKISNFQTLLQIWQLNGKLNKMMDKLDQIERQPAGMQTRTVYTTANNSELPKWENNSIKEDQVKGEYSFPINPNCF